MDQDEVTLGEVYRLCQRIEASVNKTNGRVTACETEIAILKDREDRATDTHARIAGYGGAIGAVASFLWQTLHK